MTETAKDSRVGRANRGAKPGERRGGRAPGTPNKTTLEVKQALIKAFEEMGGVNSLVDWAKDNRGDFYKLWIKIMPTQVELSNPEGDKFRIDPTPDNIVAAQEAYRARLSRP